MSDTVYSYYKVGLSYDQAEELGYRHSHSRIGPKLRMPPSVVDGRVCLRIVRPPKNSQGPFTYRVSFSFCSPADNFDRKLARRIADRPHRFIEITHDKPLKIKEVSETAMSLARGFRDQSLNVAGGFIGKDVTNVFANASCGSKGINLPRWFVVASDDNIRPEYRASRK